MRKAKKVEATRFIEYCDICGISSENRPDIECIEDRTKARSYGVEYLGTIIFIHICNICISEKLFPLLRNEYPSLKFWKREADDYNAEGEEVK